MENESRDSERISDMDEAIYDRLWERRRPWMKANSKQQQQPPPLHLHRHNPSY